MDTQVAQHLAATYGDRAFSVGKGGILNTVFSVQDLGVDTQVAQHLAATYGDRAFSVGKGGSHLCSYLTRLFFSVQRLFRL